MKIIAACIGLLAAFFTAACDWEYTPSDSKSFDTDLQGTWVSNDTGIYSGALLITYDRITITGYGEGQTAPGEDDNRRPFRAFTKGIALKGYSEEGKLFIEDGGLLQDGIPYSYWDDNPPPDYQKVKFIRFTFGDRVETVQNQ